MKKILILLLLSSLPLVTIANISGSKPAEPAVNNSDRFIAPLYGQWEGTIDYEYFENTTSKKKYSQPFKIEVNPTALTFFNKNETGEWIKANKSFTDHFNFSLQKNTIVGHFLNSGSDEDGIWVESQTIYITLKDENSILVYSIRSVNNTSVKDSVPGTKWNQTGVGELKKNAS
ncbi:MAG: hypothetical protein EOO53_14370 [Gammaproteobacteria bacterium]|nr:MAG: hypothetical protein EOO53_14370 [Gammaproteobacteria bacterium]